MDKGHIQLIHKRSNNGHPAYKSFIRNDKIHIKTRSHFSPTKLEKNF